MTVIRYYISGNTAEGYQNKLASNVETINQKVFLIHPSYTLKTLIFNEIIATYQSSSDVEILCSSWSEKFLEGVVIREKSLAIMDGTLDTGEFPEAKQIDLTEMENGRVIDTLFTNEGQINQLQKEAYKQFETGLTIHDDLEAIFIQEMDFRRADALIEQFITRHVHNKQMEQTPSHIYHRLFGTNTADGAVNIASELMQPIPKRYILKGRAGTGKSVFMKKVAKACEQKGFDVELYHCSFDPASIDMILVRNDFCIMDGTAPHEMEPIRESDVVIDLYDETVTPGTDEKYAESIQSIQKKYKAYMKTGLDFLKEAGDVLLESEARYIQATTEETRKEVITKVITLIG